MAAVEVWRAGDVAALYGVDLSTVHRWERTGRLRCLAATPAEASTGSPTSCSRTLTDPPQPDPAPAGQMSVDELVDATRRPRRRAG